MTEDVIRVAVGKWPSILISLGFTEQAVSGKHGPCPICEGKDRFRWISNDGQGRWICNQCGSGDGMNLVMDTFNIDFKTAAERVRPLVGGASYAVSPKKPDTQDIKRLLSKLMGYWRSAKDREELDRYLQARGLPKKAYSGADLRVGKIERFDKDFNREPDCNAMLARIITPKNRTAALHRTYFLPDGREKKITKTTTSISGGAIRLFKTVDEETLLVAEGIETALAARHLYSESGNGVHPCWATVSAQGMKNMAVPKNIKKIVIFADNDESFTGQAAAFDLANRLAVREKREVEVFTPKLAGDDWLDVLNKTTGEQS